MRISDWSSDVCSSDLALRPCAGEDSNAKQHAQQQPGKVIGGLRHGDGAVALAAFGTAAEEGLDLLQHEIGRASGRERVCQYVKLSVVAVSLKKKRRHRQ